MYAKQEEPAAIVGVAADVKAITPRGAQLPFSERRVLLVLVDSLLVFLATWAVMWLWQKSGLMGPDVAFLVNDRYLITAALGGWWLLALLNDLYDVPTSSNVSLTIMRLAVIGVSGAIIFFAIRFLIQRSPPVLFFVHYLLFLLPTIAAWRWVYAVTSYRPPFVHRVLVIGGGPRGRAIADVLRQRMAVKCKITGYVDDDLTARQAMPEDVPLLGRESELAQLAWNLGIHEIVVAKERNLEDDLFQHLVDCQSQGVCVSWMPNLYGKLCRQIPIEYIDAEWALHAMEGKPIFGRLQQSGKRLLDLLVVILAIPILLLIVLPIAVAIRLDSSGPAFYRQVRAGRGNRPFSIYKFRTMVVDAEKEGLAQWATKNDPRITRMGRLLRKARLDELPQILNVLRGEMSLVGPRPERPEFIEELQNEVPFYRTRLMVKPGITGWAQVQYSYGNSTMDALIKLQYDFYYIQYWSLWMDLYILYRTLGVVLKLKGI